MRTNIDIDEALMTAALSSGEFKTKREAVEEGLRLIARRNHYREILKWEGKLHWDDQPEPLATPSSRPRTAAAGAAALRSGPLGSGSPSRKKRVALA